MRILWVGKSGSTSGGEDIYDKMLITHLEAKHEVTRFTPLPVSPFRKSLNTALGIPVYRASYHSRENTRRLRHSIEKACPELVIISWEPFDSLVRNIDLPVIMILHNVTSNSIKEVFRGNPLIKLYSIRIKTWERQLYRRKNIKSLITLSEDDACLVKKLVGSKPVQVISPGMPKAAPAPKAEVRPELLISGTYGWFPKRRDLRRFVRYVAKALEFPLICLWDHPLPDGISMPDSGSYTDVHNWSPAVRFGFVPDTFVSGFKLKTGSYISNNCIVISCSDFGSDYADLPHQSTFMRKILSLDEIKPIVDEIAMMSPNDLTSMFQQFKTATINRFSWSTALEKLDSTILLATQKPDYKEHTT